MSEKTPADRGKCKKWTEELTNNGGYTYPGWDIEGEELEFIKAIDAYRIANRKSFLTMTEILKVAKSLGYRRLPPQE